MIHRLLAAMTRRQKQWVFAGLDAVTIPLAFGMSLLLVDASARGPVTLDDLWPLLLTLVVIGTALNHWLGLPRVKLNAFEMRSAFRTLVLAVLIGLFSLVLGQELAPWIPRGVHGVLVLVLSTAIVLGRVALRAATVAIYRKGQKRKPVLIYGAGRTGQQFAAALRQDDQIRAVGFVDDNPALQGMTIAGLPVHPPALVPHLLKGRGVERVVLAMPSAGHAALLRITEHLRPLGCEVQALPSFAELLGEEGDRTRLTTVPIDRLLGRTRLEDDLPVVAASYQGRCVLVTGAGGSIGAELSRQIAACEPACLVLVDHSELALYTIERELCATAGAPPIVAILGSVLDAVLMRQVIEENRIDTILHAAAYKHLPMVECNVISGLKNNVFGTRTLAEVARETAVERFILVSSDKAVRPTNVMGASKRLAELVIQDLACRSGATRFSMVRFGNVLGSSGSVIPVFQEQIYRGGPVTLTHSEVTRYFMTIPEAVRLVLLAGSFARGGDVFVLDMGDPVPIARLARQMIEGAGYTVQDEANPDGDIEIQITGLRAGEKLHEELLIAPDMLTTPHPKILRAQEKGLSEFETATALKDLREAVNHHDEGAAREVIRRWVEAEAQLEDAAQGA